MMIKRIMCNMAANLVEQFAMIYTEREKEKERVLGETKTENV